MSGVVRRAGRSTRQKRRLNLAGELDDYHVYKIIVANLHGSRGSSITDHLGDAWDLSRADRESFHPGDVDYAAAEHYLFARWLIAWTGMIGWPFIAMSSGGYDLLKKYLPPAMIQKLSMGDGPVTPYTPGDIQWARRGASAGLDDFKDGLWGRTVVYDPDYPPKP